MIEKAPQLHIRARLSGADDHPRAEVRARIATGNSACGGDQLGIFEPSECMVSSIDDLYSPESGSQGRTVGPTLLNNPTEAARTTPAGIPNTTAGNQVGTQFGRKGARRPGGVTVARKNTTKTARIPNDLTLKLLSRAINWVLRLSVY